MAVRCACGSGSLRPTRVSGQVGSPVSRPQAARCFGPLHRPHSVHRHGQHVTKAGNQPDVVIVSPSSIFEEQLRMMNEVDKVMQQADRSMDRAMRQAEADLARARQALQQQEQELQRAGPSVRVQRQEESSTGRYSYRESIQIQYNNGGYYYTPASTPAPSFVSPALIVAAILAGVYAAVTAAFVKNFDLTVYKDQGRWVLAPLWPFLLLFNGRFRNQFWAALRGEKPSLDETPAQ